MKLTFLGTSGYHPSETRHTSCIMLPEHGIVLDAGTGFFRARDLLCTSDLHVFLTHAHLDHTMGLTYIFDVMHERDLKQVVVHGDGLKIEAIQNHLFAPVLFPVKPPLAFRALPSIPMKVADVSISHFPLEHPGGSIGFRLECGDKSFAYVTDTTASEDSDYIEHIQGVDLLIHECHFRDGHESHAALTGHSCTSQVAKVAAKAKAKRLMLVHINPLESADDPVDIATARAIFPETEIAYDLQSIEV